MAGLRELVLKLSANTVEFRKDLGAAVRDVNLFSSQMTRSMKSANAALTGFAVAAAGALTIGSLVAEVNRVVDALNNLQDMAEKTGSSVENLSRLSKVVSAFGGDFQQVNLALNNLAKGMAGVDDESSKVRHALEALGISTKDLASKDPSQLFIEIAKSLQGYQDGAAKAALVTDLFKKGAVDLLPYMNDVAENVDKFGGTSAAAAASGVKFQDALGVLKVRSDEFHESLVVGALPAVTDFITALTSVLQESDALGNDTAIADWADNAVTALTAVMNAADGVRRVFQYVGETIGATAAVINASSASERKAIASLYDKRVDQIANQPLVGNAVRDKMAAQREARQANARNPDLATTSSGKKDGRAELDYKSLESEKQAQELRKKLSEQAIKALDLQVSQEKDLLASRNRFLDLYNGDNLLSLKDYYAARKAAQQENVNTTTALYDKEIATLEKYKRATSDQGQRAETQSKIDDIKLKKADLQRQASEDAIVDTVKEQKAFEDLAREIRNVNAELLALQGKTKEAAQLRFTDQYSGLRKRLTAEGDQGGLDAVNQLEKAQIAQAEYNQLQEQSSLIQDKLRNGEERIAITRLTGASSELQSLAKISAARQQAVKDLEAIVINQERVAEASKNPALIIQAQAARNALEKLRAESDLLAQKFEAIFTGSMASALTDFVTGAKSAEDAFRSFADSVVQQITRMAAEAVTQQLYQKLFGAAGGEAGGAAGGGGGAGGIFGAFGKMMGGSGSAGGLFGSIASAFGFGGGSGFGTTGIFAGEAATAAQFGAGPMMSAADLAVFPGLASGGPTAANSPYWVGEFGKELFVPETNGRIVPRNAMSGGNSSVINITQNIPKEMSRQNANQLAADAGMHVNRALRRNT